MVDTSRPRNAGFCTPGFVMSLYGHLDDECKPSVQEIEKALQAISVAAPVMRRSFGRGSDCIGRRARPGSADREREEITRQLEALRDGRRVEIGGETSASCFRPRWTISPWFLRQTPRRRSSPVRPMSALVTQFMRDIAPSSISRILENCGGSPSTRTGSALPPA